MRYSRLLHFIIVLVLGMCVTAFAQDNTVPCDATAENPCIVQDSFERSSPIVWLRDAAMISQAYHGSTVGIEQLFISGSEAPSARGWADIANYIKQKKPLDAQVVVIDLRQESHGYLNGRAINLTNKYDWINLDKSNEQSALAQQSWLRTLREQVTVSNILTPIQFALRDFSHGKTMVVIAVHDEQYYVNKQGFMYRHLYVTDHRAPADSEVDAFIHFIQSHPANTWFHVHCRGGKGRTTTFLAMYDMLKNADKVTFEEIIARQASVPPYYNLQQTHRKEKELTPYYEQRLMFLRHFHEYARQRLIGNCESAWHDWTQLMGYQG